MKPFQEIINSKDWVMVCWTAEWCTACKGSHMVLEQVVEEYAGKLEVVIVDIQAYQQAANEYLVRGLPRYSLFHKGKHKYSVAGTKTFREFKDWLDEVMHEDN